MSAFKNIQVVLSASTGNLSQQLALAAREVEAFGKKVEGTSNAAASSSTQLLAAHVRTAAAATAVAVGLAYSVKAAAEFETQMRNVNSISGLSEKALHDLGGQVLDLSRQLPQSATDLAKGLYDIASSGFQGAAGVTVLENAAKAASAGLSDTATSAKAITAVLNSYGLGADQAKAVSDSLFQTVNLGVVSFSELANSIGDVVGFAAQAGISIDQVGAAIASMTLAGLNGAEATTSLNRLIQGLIDPSDALATVYQQLGIHIVEDLKNPAIGLHGVLEQLRVATGGGIESTLALFNDIRATKGFLAATANEGASYSRVLDGMAAAHKGAGATAAALHEQMKALGAQWDLFRNRANAAAIELGTRLIPVVLDAVSAVQSLAASALPSLQHALTALAPSFAGVVQVGGNLVDVAKALVAALGPSAKILAGLVAGSVISGLNALATVLASITGFLAHHPALVTAVAVAYGAHLAVAVAEAVVWFGRLGAVLVSDALDKAAVGAYNAAGGISSLGGALRGLATVAGPIAIIGGITAAIFGLNDASRKAKELRDDISRSVDPTQLSSIEAAAKRTGAEMAKIPGYWGGNRILDSIKGTVEAWTPLPNAVADAFSKTKQLTAEQDQLNRMYVQSQENVAAITKATGLSAAGVATLAAKLKVDLTGGFGASADERKKLIDYVRHLATETGTTGTALTTATEVDIAKMEELASTIADVKKKVGEVFASSTDFIAAFNPSAAETATKAVADAKAQLTDARQALDDLAARSGAKTKQSIGDEQEMRKARERVAEATSKVADAESKVTTNAGQIAAFYKGQIALTSQFATDLTTAAAKGLDPEVLKRLLTAGPEKAAPILQAILSDHSGKLIGIVNDSEAKLRAINSRVVEFARLTQLAVSSSTDHLASDLGTAMALAATNMEQGAKATAASIAQAIGKPADEVRRVAKEYGITLGNETVAGYTAATQALRDKYIAFYSAPPGGAGVGPLRPLTPEQAAALGIPLPKKHSGGFIGGSPGEEVPAVLQSGEYVLRAAAVRAVGVPSLEHMNRTGSVPKFHGGGYVGPMPAVSSASSATIDYDRLAAAIAKGNPGARSMTHQYNFGGIYGPSIPHVLAEAERRAALAALGGE